MMLPYMTPGSLATKMLSRNFVARWLSLLLPSFSHGILGCFVEYNNVYLILSARAQQLRANKHLRDGFTSTC